jgi:hypothetical protein
MNAAQKWAQKMNSYYINIDAHSLKADLQSAGFSVIDSENATNQDVVKNQLIISFNEAASSSELYEDLHTTKVLVDKNGQLLDIV